MKGNALTELGFFAVILDHGIVEDSSRLSLPLTFDTQLITPSFMVWIKCFVDTRVFQDEEGEVILVFHGQVCDDASLSRFVGEYKRQGTSFVESLNGSFAFLLVDKLRDKVVLATDRLGSRKVYVRKEGSMFVVSTVLKHLFTRDLSIDPIGLAWYLSNGVVHNNRTVFDGISVLDRASCCTFDGDAPAKPRKYWQYRFTGEYGHKSLTWVRKEFETLLVESVRRRVADDYPVILSLSAGYDSPGVLGILSERLDVDNLCSFSHGLYEDDEESDAYISRYLAEMYGISHRFILSYDGYLCGAIERNALWGDGVAHFCDESLMWSAFHDQYAGQNRTLFVADECFGGIGGNAELFRSEDILAICKILDFSCLRWLRHFLSRGVYRMFLDGQREDVAAIFDRVPHATDIHDIKDFIYLDQRLSCVHMPWREYFASRTFRVQNPFLDNDLLDFMRKLPSQWRRGKRLYKETIASMFPEIFAVKRATVGGFVPDAVWAKDMLRERELIIERYLSSDHFSMLDAFITPDSIVRLLLMEEEIPDKVGLAVERVVSLSYRVINKVLRKVRVREIGAWNNSMLGRTEFLLRYFVLRRFLEIAEQDSMLLKLALEL